MQPKTQQQHVRSPEREESFRQQCSRADRLSYTYEIGHWESSFSIRTISPSGTPPQWTLAILLVPVLVPMLVPFAHPHAQPLAWHNLTMMMLMPAGVVILFVRGVARARARQ